MADLKKYKALWVTPATHSRIVKETTKGKTKRSIDNVLKDLLRMNNERKTTNK